MRNARVVFEFYLHFYDLELVIVTAQIIRYHEHYRYVPRLVLHIGPALYIFRSVLLIHTLNPRKPNVSLLSKSTSVMHCKVVK